uniref:Solute carrier family 12 member 3 n=1 Tax=Acrobeloides nanus TaxID=290746 RepID=A0A914C146_9BILA
MNHQNSIQSNDEYDGVQFDDNIQVHHSYPRFSLITTDEEQEEIMEMFNPVDDEADRYIERMCEMKRGSTNLALDEALDESFLRELSILKMYPSKKPKQKTELAIEEEKNKKENGGIFNKIKTKFRSRKDVISPKLPEIQVISNDINLKPMPDIVIESSPRVVESSPHPRPEIKIEIEEDEDEATQNGEDEATQNEVEILGDEGRERKNTLDHPPDIDFYTLNVPTDGKLPHSLSHRASLAELVLADRSSITSLPEAYSTNLPQDEDSKPPPSSRMDKIKNMFSCKKDPNAQDEKKLLGWVEGVFVRCVSNIFGVMLYLRIGWMAAQAGLLWGSMIILVSSAITMVTALSTSAICTNGVVSGGGIYFLISRSIGPEFGGSIGIIFAITNGFGAAMYLVGMAETLLDVFNSYGIKIIDGGINDTRIIGLTFCVILILVVFAGTNFESKTQVILVFVIFISIIDYYIGSVMPVTNTKAVRGFTGYSFETFKENFLSDFRNGYTIISVFAVYFPAATGIMAGANISGDLKNPSKSIPLGTVLAIIFTSIIYFTFLWISGFTTVRDADGTHAPVRNHNESVSGEWAKPDCFYDNSCKYGIMNDYQVVQISSLWGPLIVAGVFASTLSSALSCLVSAPKLFQVVCKDKLFPYIGWFGQGYGPNNEPRKAYALFFLLACAIICIGELNSIAPFITNFYLGTYALVNYACFDCAFSRSLSFRPSFRYWNKWLSLFCAFICVGCMIAISWYTSIATLAFFFLLYLYLWKMKPATVNWGTSDQAHAYRNALHYVRQLNNLKVHVKTYRPQILVLSGNPASRPSLVDFVYSISKGSSLMMCGNIVPIQNTDGSLSMVKSLNSKTQIWLKNRKIKAYSISVANQNIREGARAIMQASGLGQFKPNVLFMGFKQNWDENGIRGIDEIDEYIGLIFDAFESNMSVSILRNNDNGLDLTGLMSNYNLVKVPAKPRGSVPWINQRARARTMLIAVSKNSLDHDNGSENSSDADTDSDSDMNSEISDDDSKHLENAYGRNSEQKGLVIRINQFRTKIKKGVIDVWWIYDDGGLTLLLPYLLSHSKSYIEGAKLRIFTLATHAGKLDDDQEEMVKLLKKFRIDHIQDVTVFANVQSRPDEEMISEFESIVTPFRVPNRDNPSTSMITQAELLNQQDRTWRYLRIASLLRNHSSESDLVVVTLPVPRQGQNNALYMAWLDIMTRGLPPTLLVRGNQSNVLTFYA